MFGLTRKVYLSAALAQLGDLGVACEALALELRDERRSHETVRGYLEQTRGRLEMAEAETRAALSDRSNAIEKFHELHAVYTRQAHELSMLTGILD